MKVNKAFVLLVVVWAIVGSGEGKGDWFKDYVDRKDEIDMEVEGEALDISVDAGGKSKTGCH